MVFKVRVRGILGLGLEQKMVFKVRVRGILGLGLVTKNGF